MRSGKLRAARRRMRPANPRRRLPASRRKRHPHQRQRRRLPSRCLLRPKRDRRQCPFPRRQPLLPQRLHPHLVQRLLHRHSRRQHRASPSRPHACVRRAKARRTKKKRRGAAHMPPPHPRLRLHLLPLLRLKERRPRWWRLCHQHLSHQRPCSGSCRRTRPGPLRVEGVRMPTSRAPCATRPSHVPQLPGPAGHRRACRRRSPRWTSGHPSTSRAQAWACATHAVTSKAWRRW